MAAWGSLYFCLLGFVLGVEGSRVLELSDRFIEVSKEGMWLVKFYAPWCGHCKKLEPIWNQVSQSLHFSPVRVGRVDCTKYTSVASTYKVKGFPTILFIKGENIYTYNGDRTREEIVDFATRLSGPPAQNLEKYEDFVNAKKRHNVFFLYIGDKNEAESQLWDRYQEVAEKFLTTNFFYSASAECVEQELKFDVLPQVAVFKDDTYHLFTASEDEDLNSTLWDWVNKERFVIFTKITNGNFYQVMKTGKFIVMAVVEENKVGQVTTEMAKFREMVQSTILKNKDKFYYQFQFGWVGQPEIANSVAMESLPIPSLLVVNSNTFQHYIPEDDPNQLTEEALADFLNQILNNSVPAYGGDSYLIRMYRAFYEAKTSLFEMWRGNPVLTAVLFGLPLGFLSLICYSVCCADIMEATEEEELLERERRHAKKE